MKRVTVLVLILVLLAGGAGVFYWMSTAEIRDSAAMLPQLKKDAVAMGLILDEGSEKSVTTVDPAVDGAKALRTLGAAIDTRLPARDRLADGYGRLAAKHPELVESAASVSQAKAVSLGGLESPVLTDLRLAASLLLADAMSAAKARKFSRAEQRFEQANRLILLLLSHPRKFDLDLFLQRRLAHANSIMSLASTHDRDAEMLDFCSRQIDLLPRVPEYTELLRLTIYDQIVYARDLNRSDMNYVDVQSEEVISMFPEGAVQIPMGEAGSAAMEARVLEFWTQFLAAMKTGDAATRADAANIAMESLKKASGKSYTAIKMQRPDVIRLVRLIEAIKVWDATAKLGINIFEARRKTGQFPKDLPDTPLRTDPFVSGSMKYSVVGSGFRIYSVGANKTDDGGPKLKGLTYAGEVADDLGYVHNPTQVDSPESPVAIAEIKGRPRE